MLVVDDRVAGVANGIDRIGRSWFPNRIHARFNTFNVEVSAARMQMISEPGSERPVAYRLYSAHAHAHCTVQVLCMQLPYDQCHSVVYYDIFVSIPNRWA